MYFLLIIAALLLAVFFSVNKIYQKNAGTTLKAGFVYNSFLGFFVAIIFFAMAGFEFEFTTFSLILAIGMTVLVTAYTLLGFRILKDGGVATYSIFLMTGGMTVPYIYGLLFLDEEFSLVRTFGLLLLISAVVLSNFKEGGERIKASKLAMCIIVFFLNGFVSVISKLHQIEAYYDTVGTESFVMLGGIVKFVLAGIAALIIIFIDKRKSSEADTTSKSEIKVIPAKKILTVLLPLIIFAAAVDGVSYFLQLKGAANLPATVLYPAVTGASMVFSALADMIIFREKPSKPVIVSVCLCFVATLMFL